MAVKVISFSFWGSDPKYLKGAVENALLAKEIYPDWKCWFHVPGYYKELVLLEPYIQQIRELNDQAHIITMEARGDWTGMFWRFLPMCQNRFDAVISRDVDSRLTMREKAAVDEWLDSPRGFHIMRDHPWHSTEILGGMWGMKKGCLPEFRDLMKSWNQEDRWQTDQDFLKSLVYPLVVKDAMIHAPINAFEAYRSDHVFDIRDFPIPRNGLEFVGEIYDENNVPNEEHRQILANYLCKTTKNKH